MASSLETGARFAPGPLIVFAPHPDDDVIGCGGTLARLAEAGARCTIVYVTDGSGSHAHSKSHPASTLAALREDEARASIELLGVRAEQIFLREADGALGSLLGAERDRLIGVAIDLIEQSDAETVYAPWRRDPHGDHIATAEIVEEALARIAVKPRLLMYAVWLGIRAAPIDAPRAGEVTTTTERLTASRVARKRAAILAHRSQTSALIGDDATGFRIGPELLAAWTVPFETFFTPHAGAVGSAVSSA